MVAKERVRRVELRTVVVDARNIAEREEDEERVWTRKGFRSIVGAWNLSVDTSFCSGVVRACTWMKFRGHNIR